jgi:hypothetical protein
MNGRLVVSLSRRDMTPAPPAAAPCARRLYQRPVDLFGHAGIWRCLTESGSATYAKQPGYPWQKTLEEWLPLIAEQGEKRMRRFSASGTSARKTDQDKPRCHWSCGTE